MALLPYSGSIRKALAAVFPDIGFDKGRFACMLRSFTSFASRSPLSPLCLCFHTALQLLCTPHLKVDEGSSKSMHNLTSSTQIFLRTGTLNHFPVY